METRKLGRTGHMSTVVIFGAAALSTVSQDEANKALETALAEEINHIDVAPQYGDAEERVGNWFQATGNRDKFFLGCKTLEREKDAAWEDLQQSLKWLHTEKLDLYQLHAIGTMDELAKAMAPGGAIDTLKRAKDEGLTRFLGITGHGLDTPKVHMAALEQFDFDTVMFPLNPVLYGIPGYRRDTEKLLQMCVEKEVGVMIIKAITKEPWTAGEKAAGKPYHTWYKPYDTQEKITEGVHFALSQKGVTTIASAGDTRLLDRIIQAGESYQRMSKDEQAAMIQVRKSFKPIFDESGAID